MNIIITMKAEGAYRALIEGEHNAQNLAPALLAIAGELDDRVQNAFETKSDPVSGTAWVELRPATVRERERKGYGGTDMLERTRILRSSVLTEADAIGVSVTAGGVEYGPHHQFGTKHIPQRRFAGISPDDATQFEDILVRHLTGA